MLQDRCDYFILAYEAPNFSAAASKVPMSPQGFSKAVHNLERELGVPLFVVDEDGTRRATPYADEFYEYAKRVRAERNLLASAFETIASSGYVELRVACSLGVPGFLGPNFLEAFLELHPDVSITLNEMPDALCESALRDGIYDLALVVAPTSGDIVTNPLFSCPVWYWVRRDDPLASLDSLGIEDLAGRRLAIPGDDFKCYQALAEGVAQAGCAMPEITKCSEIFWIYEFVLRGEGIGFTLPHLAKLEVFDGNDDVVALPLRGFSWGFGVSHLKTRSLTLPEENLVAFLQQHSAKLKNT